MCKSLKDLYKHMLMTFFVQLTSDFDHILTKSNCFRTYLFPNGGEIIIFKVE